LHAERSRHREPQGFERLADAFDDQAVDDAGVAPQEMQCDAHLDAARQPRNSMPKCRERQAARLPVTGTNGLVESLDGAASAPAHPAADMQDHPFDPARESEPLGGDEASQRSHGDH